MSTTRRGFLKGCFIGAATVAVSLRMSQTPTRLTEYYTWDRVNEDYSYGIDRDAPWDVVILDEGSGEYIEPRELMQRGTPALGSNQFDDPVDRAFTTVAAIAMSQGMLAFRDSVHGVFAFEEMEEFDSVPRIITSKLDYDMEVSRA